LSCSRNTWISVRPAAARFGASASRLDHADELDALVAAWIADRSRDDVVAAFLAARIPVSPVNDVRDVLADPHITARGGIPAPGPGPGLGAHDAEVRRDWLGDA